MATTITPGVGAGVLLTQQGVGADPGYAAIDDRRMASLAYQEGVIGGSDFMVVERAAGPDMSVDVGMPAGGFACVQGDSVAGQGIYVVPVHASTVNEAIAASDPSNPRVDQVILEVLDNVHDASGSSLARVRVLTGTATTGATLSNRLGVAALPGSALLLADVLVDAGATSVTNAKVRDRRKFARGAFRRILRQSGATGNGYETTSGGLSSIDATNLAPRIECSGKPLRLQLIGKYAAGAAGKRVSLTWTMDGVSVDGASIGGQLYDPVSDYQHFNVSWTTTPAAGSHVFAPTFASFDATTNVIIAATSNKPLEMVVEEIVRGDAANNSVTSG